MNVRNWRWPLGEPDRRGAGIGAGTDSRSEGGARSALGGPPREPGIRGPLGRSPPQAARREVTRKGSLGRIASNPLAFPTVHGETRRAIVTRFPYGVYFRLSKNEIVITAVMHRRRHPRTWQARHR